MPGKRTPWSLIAVAIAVLPLVLAAPREAAYGGLTVSAAGTLAVLVLFAVTQCASPFVSRSGLRAAAPFLLVTLVGTAMLVSSPSGTGAQNVVAYAVFSAAILVGASPVGDSAQRLVLFDRFFTISGLVLSAYLLIGVVPSWPSPPPGGRVIALVLGGLVLWNFSGASRWPRWVGFTALLMIVLTVSRMALAATVGLLLVGWALRTARHRTLRIATAGIVAVAIVGLVAATDNPLRERFTTGDVSMQILGVQINAMGRTAVWEALIDSARESPHLGQGPGSSEAAIHERVTPLIDHPHNDYLRLVHDFGWPVAALWVFGLARLLVSSGRRTMRLGARPADLAGFSASAFIAITMISDNVIVYTAVVAPLGLIIGNAVGGRARATWSASGEPSYLASPGDHAAPQLRAEPERRPHVARG